MSRVCILQKRKIYIYTYIYTLAKTNSHSSSTKKKFIGKFVFFWGMASVQVRAVSFVS